MSFVDGVDTTSNTDDIVVTEVPAGYAGQELTAAADANLHGAFHVLPASAKVQLHELTSENAVLKARLRSTVQELKNTRELCQRLSSQSGGRGAGRSRSARDGGPGAYKDSAVQTKELKGLRPLAVAMRAAASSGTSLTSCTVGVQTNVGGKDCIVVPANGGESQLAAAIQGGMNDEVRRLKAEVLRSHAECASLHHAIQIMKNASSPRRGAGPDSGAQAAQRALFPDADEAASAEAQSVAKASHLAAMDRIATLTEALRQANESIANLERDLTKARTAAVDPASHHAGPDSDASARHHQQAHHHVLKLNKATITDDAQLNVRLPTAADRSGAHEESSSAAARVNKSSALEQALSITRAQLNEALDELSAARGAAGAGKHAAASTVSVGVAADLRQPLDELFRAHGLEMTVDSVEELLGVRTRHLELVRHTRDLEAKALSSTNSAAVRELTSDLEQARKELTAAHQHIDELHYALDLEKRERFNPQNLLERYAATDAERERMVVANDSQKQAAAEIAFLCDTLAATKADAETLRSQLEQASIERDSALHSFRELKAKTEAVLRGCQEITEATRSDADQAISSLTHTVHQKDSEIFSLRGQMAALQRDLEKTSKALHACEKEVDAAKQRVATVQSAMSKLREDSNAQAAQLREVRAQLAAHHASALSSPRGMGGASTVGTPTPRGPVGGRGAPQQLQQQHAARTGGSSSLRRPAPAIASPASQRRSTSADAAPAAGIAAADLSSIQALQQALDDRERDAAAARRLGDFGSPSPTLERSRSASPPGGYSTARRRAAAARTAAAGGGEGAAAADMPYDELRAEYEELRSCFLMLAAMAPNALTAREVTDAITAAFDAQKERCAAVERELRKRTTALQTLKKELQVSRESLAELEKKTSQSAAMEQRIAALNRQVEKQKRAAMQLVAEHADSDEKFKLRVQDLEAELEQTREALGAARQELREGRELMLSLIGEDREALNALAALTDAASRDGNNTDAASAAGAGDSTAVLQKTAAAEPAN